MKQIRPHKLQEECPARKGLTVEEMLELLYKNKEREHHAFFVDCIRSKLQQLRAQVTSEADGWCAESPEGELQKQLYSSNEDMGWSSLVGINSRSPEPYLVVQATRKLVADGWRVVPVKIVKVGEAQRNSSETMRDEN